MNALFVNSRNMVRRFSVLGLAAVLSVCLGLLLESSAHAQLVWGNFEDPNNTDGFVPAIPADFPDSSYLEHERVAGIGNTSGNGALRVEFGDTTSFGGTVPTFAWAVRHDLDPNNPANAAEYDMFNTVAADEGNWFLEFDLFIAANEWSDPDLLDPGSSFQLRTSVNSDDGFFGVENVTGGQALNFFEGSHSVRIPMTNLPLAENSSFYQFNIGSASNFFQGLGEPPEGIDIYFDNFRFVQALPSVSRTLFSWETPDDGNTPSVDEQLEGWAQEGYNPGDVDQHIHSISTLGVTDGSSSLQIDRRNRVGNPGEEFVWGSTVRFNSDIDPDPNVEVIDAEIQGRIDEIVDLINSASAIAFDVRFDDPFPNEPTYTIFDIALTDATGHFFQGSGIVIGSTVIGDATTYSIQTNSFVDQNAPGGLLSDVGLDKGNALSIGLATNTNGGGIYQIDNFRVIIELSADFDSDNDVDGDDFLIWQRNAGQFSGDALRSDGDSNGDGFVNAADLAKWESQYGLSAPVVPLSAEFVSELGAAVPEPASLVMLTIGSCMAGLRRRRVA